MIAASLRLTLLGSLSAGVVAAETEQMRAARAYAECAAFYRLAADYAARDKRSEFDQLARIDIENAAVLSDRDTASEIAHAAVPKIAGELKSDRAARARYQEHCDREVPANFSSLVSRHASELHRRDER